MIKHIYVNGFRTLVDFNITINPGVNILVGPNGGGKTTIITFFSFLNKIRHDDLSIAISSMGGAGALFRKKGKSDYDRVISSKIFGSIPLRAGNLVNNGSDEKYLEFKYEFEIHLSHDREDVYYKSQELCLRFVKKESQRLDRITRWDFNASRSIAENGSAQTSVVVTGNDWSKFAHPRIVRNGTTQRSDIFTEYLTENLGSGESILNVSRLFNLDLRMLFDRNFIRGILYNPQPDQIRKPEDSAKHPGIRSDGSGLYASLLAIKRRKNRIADRSSATDPSRNEVSFSRTHDVTLPRLIDYFKLAFPALYTLDVINDSFDNQIRVRVTLDAKEGIQLPLASLSDGTLKWMALVTALVTARHIIAIEEPENFIHPAVQQHALELIRSETKEDSFVLVSSHSQSVLDAAKPDELIIVSLEKSRTIARRVENPQRVRCRVPSVHKPVLQIARASAPAIL